MEHIVQFAINIDDKTIQKRLEDHKAEIIDAAVEKLTKSIRNSKAFKERKTQVMEDTE